jgi:hypothetical protein
MQSYAGTPDDQGAISIPEDLDVADSESVNRAFRALRNSLLTIASAAAGAPIHHLVRTRCSDGVNIQITQVPTYIQDISPPARYQLTSRAAEQISVAQLDVAPPFKTYTPYYIYLVNNNGVRSYAIRETIPTQDLVGEALRPSRYIGSFMTDGAGAIVKFRKVGFDVTFVSGAQFVLNGSRNAAWTTLDLKPYLPPHASVARLKIEVYNINPVSEVLSVRAKNDSNVVELYSGIGNAAGTERSYNSLEYDQILGSTQEIEYKTSPAQGGFANIWVRGYKEG